jgi:Bacterial Ig-like domain (group 2)
MRIETRTPVSREESRVRRTALTATVCILAIAACDFPIDIELCPLQPVGPVYVAISPYRDTVVVGDTLRLFAEVSEIGESAAYSCEFCCPTGRAVTETPIEWSSSNSRVATVTASGVVVGRAPGSATIIARAPSFRVATAQPILVVARSP